MQNVNKAKRAEYNKQYRAKNLEKLHAYDKSRNHRAFKHNRSLKGMYSKMKGRAKENNVPMTLTFEDFEAIRKLPCAYCAKPLPAVGYGIDRYVNDAGYTKENSTPCCHRCNIMKGNLSYEAFKSQIEAIYNHIIK